MLSTALLIVATILFVIDAVRSGSLVSWGLACVSAALVAPGVASLA